MKIYTIIAGVNGAGKSSLTGVLRQEMNDLGVIVCYENAPRWVMSLADAINQP